MLKLVMFFNLFKPKTQFQELYALVDNDTEAILCLGKHYQVMNFLTEYTFDGYLDIIAPPDNLGKLLLNKLHSDVGIYKFSWSRRAKRFVNVNRVTEELKQKSELAQAKYKLLETVYNSIVWLRARTKRTLEYQEVIYLAKKLEAEKYKEKGYPENDILSYPYLLQYANLVKIPYKEAADTILVKAKLGDNILARSETLRMKYFGAIRDAKSKEELEEIKKNFILEIEVKM